MQISMTRPISWLNAGLLFAALCSLGACDKSPETAGKGPAEVAGKEIDKAAVVAGKELKQAAEQTGKALEKAGAKLQEKVQEKTQEKSADKAPDAVVTTPAPQK